MEDTLIVTVERPATGLVRKATISEEVLGVLLAYLADQVDITKDDQGNDVIIPRFTDVGNWLYKVAIAEYQKILPHYTIASPSLTAAAKVAHDAATQAETAKMQALGKIMAGIVIE